MSAAVDNHIDSDRTKGGLCQTIKKAIRVVVVNKVEANKAAARETKAAAVVAKKAAAARATAKLTIQYEACDELS
jgi:hypothetical protein